MKVYRITKSRERALDLSGMGAYKFGGRWNNKGTCMLYTSMNSSLAYLESLVHFNESDIPPDIFIAEVEIKDAKGSVYQLPDTDYPNGWQAKDNLKNKLLGDKFMSEMKFPAIKVRSAINPSEYNFLLNPLFPGFHDRVVIGSIYNIGIDIRLLGK